MKEITSEQIERFRQNKCTDCGKKMPEPLTNRVTYTQFPTLCKDCREIEYNKKNGKQWKNIMKRDNNEQH